MTSLADLDWWLDKAKSLVWTFAKTMADTPHEYVVLDRTIGMTRDDFIRAAKVIHTFGQPGKFHSSTNIYLTVEHDKWWTMDTLLNDTDLINHSDPRLVYGKQDAPHTAAPFNKWDEIACDWDFIRDSSKDDEVKRQIREAFGNYAPMTLDIGCGSGALLDLGVVSPLNYTGVDSSQAMLNALVRKHPRVMKIHPKKFEDMLFLTSHFELVVAMDVPGLDMERLRWLSTNTLITTGESN